VRDGLLQPGVHLLRKPYEREQLAAKLRELLGATEAAEAEVG